MGSYRDIKGLGCRVSQNYVYFFWGMTTLTGRPAEA